MVVLVTPKPISQEVNGIEVSTVGRSFHPFYSQMLEVVFHYASSTGAIHCHLGGQSSIADCGDMELPLVAESHLNESYDNKNCSASERDTFQWHKMVSNVCS